MARNTHTFKYTARQLDTILDRASDGPFIIWHDEGAGVYRFFPDEERRDAWIQADRDQEMTPEIDAYQFAQPITALGSGSGQSVLYIPQSLTEEQRSQARQNIGAGTSNFDGSYNSLDDLPTIPTVPEISQDLSDDASSTTKTTSPKAVKDYVDGEVGSVENAISLINGKIPSAASSENQLADKNYVNSQISTNTATFIGTYATFAELELVTATNNDYAFVIEVDSLGNEYYDRYKYVTGTGWVYEYKVENTPFTSDQWAAIQSGITAALVTKLDALPTNTDLSNILDGKANKSEMSVVPGEGGNADKTTITLKTGTSATVLTQHQSVSGFATKVQNAVNGNFAGLDSNGNLVDSGSKASDFATAEQGRKADTSIQGVTVNGVTVVPSSSVVNISIPVSTSDITNDSGFITKNVNDLVNYYLKSELYTKDEISQIIGATNQFHYEIATSTSSVSNPQNNVLYLIGPTGGGSDKYEEYVYPNSTIGWVKIGDTSLDLSDYITIDQLSIVLSDYVPESDLIVAFSAKADKVVPQTAGNIAKLTGEGNLADSGILASEVATIDDVTPKADKVLDAVNGNFAALDAYGNLVDSGHKHSDYLTQHQDISGKANKDEMSFVAGTGANADKTTITLKEGTSATVLTQHQDISGKQDVIQDLSTIRSGASAGATAYQKPDTGIPSTDLASEITEDIDNKADKVSSPVSGNFAGLDSNGNLTDSGSKASDFATSTRAIPPGGNAGQVLKKVSATNYDITWANQSETLPSAYCSTAGDTAAKRANCSLYKLVANQYLQVLIGSDNTSASALTLEVNSQGQKPIYINGVASSSTNYTLPGSTYIVFYDGTNYYFRTDGKIQGPGGTLELTANKVTSITSLSTDTEYPSSKCVYSEVHPAVGSSQPAGGMLPNVMYNLGTLTGTVTFSMASATDNTIINHWYWTFGTSSTAPTITWPQAITSWYGGSAPTINASKHYEISVLNGIGVAMEV
jgi:hypothetical protein